jgi:hypothetical protein
MVRRLYVDLTREHVVGSCCELKKHESWNF